ncbi:unnamed protein product, partial [Rotaria sp. Silwood1]
SAVELLIANNKIKLMELNKNLDRETISFGYLKESIEIIAYVYHISNFCKLYRKIQLNYEDII